MGQKKHVCFFVERVFVPGHARNEKIPFSNWSSNVHTKREKNKRSFKNDKLGLMRAFIISYNQCLIPEIRILMN